MKVLGLTGSIGMGKSSTAAMFRQLDVPVYDADAAVHAIYQKGGSAVVPLGQRFPDALVDGAIDRSVLRAQVLNNPEAMAELEAIVHPLVGQSQLEFRDTALAEGRPLVVLDVPLLFETSGDRRVDAIVVVSAPLAEQRARVLARPGMTESDFEAILAKQIPDAEKRARADFVISTAWGFDFTRDHVRIIVKLFNELETR
ncbi:MAG: dephospho-CoA kinase [Hyphomonadaceae bacterium]|nr:dephospho-CoA kinase [Hyphomonadaceae bacterium]OUX94608.1 MAG: dephospho-CoA kinase [Hyphomonas sp. TMED17]CAI8351545.1 MAG: Dephospho-CoA kinase [Hyphomonas sp. TMED17]